MFLKNREGETPPDCCSHNSKAWAALQANRRERDAKNSRHSPEEKILYRFKIILRLASLKIKNKKRKAMWGLHTTVDIREKKCLPGRPR